MTKRNIPAAARRRKTPEELQEIAKLYGGSRASRHVPLARKGGRTGAKRSWRAFEANA